MLDTTEIDNERTKGHLSSKFHSAALPVFQHIPELSLRLGHPLAQFPRKKNFVPSRMKDKGE